MATDTLRTHLVEELADLLDAERQLTRALPRMATLAATSQLRAALLKHLGETQEHVGRVKRALTQLGASPDSQRSKGMKALLDEGETIVSEAGEGPIRDAVLIASAQKLQHYEIASYRTACTYAQVLGMSSIARLLSRTLKEEKVAEQTLTQIAEHFVNEAAATEWKAEQVHRQWAATRSRSFGGRGWRRRTASATRPPVPKPRRRQV